MIDQKNQFVLGQRFHKKIAQLSHWLHSFFTANNYGVSRFCFHDVSISTHFLPTAFVGFAAHLQKLRSTPTNKKDTQMFRANSDPYTFIYILNQNFDTYL